MAEAARTYTANRGISQPLDVLTRSIRGLSATRVSSEAVSIQALTQSAGSIFRSVGQTMGVLVQAIREMTAVRAVSQPLEALAQTFRQLTADRSASQPLQMLSNVARRLTAIRLPSEAISLRAVLGGGRLFEVFVQTVTLGLSDAVRQAHSLGGGNIPWPPMFPPFILPSAQHTRLVFESISVEGAASSAQKIFRTVLQSITSSSGIWDSITAAPAEIFRRFASAVLEIIVGTPGAFHSPVVVPPDEPTSFPWTLFIGLLLGIMLLILYWYSRRRGAGGLHVVLDDEQPPPPLDQPPQPVPVPAMG
jgi:hypothetical protein